VASEEWTLDQNLRMKTYVSAWKKLPRSIAKEYLNGASVLEISVKHNTHTDAVRRALRAMNVQMRPPGTLAPGQIKHNQKLTDDKIQQILDIDQNQPEIPHIQIAAFFGVSRERIRQICKAAGRITRREKYLPKAIFRQEAIKARKLVRKQRAKDVSKAWKEGMSIQNISILMYGKIKSSAYVMSRITYFRDRYGLKMFPYRRPSHWQLLTLDERAKRITAMAKEWNAHGDIHRIQKMFGYKTYASAQISIYRMSKLSPELFDSVERIFQRKVKQQTERQK